MFGIGNLPSGDKDPFALRRHALGIIRMLMDKDLALDWRQLLALAVPVFGNKITDPSEALTTFLFDRLAGSLREQGFSAQEVDAVLALHPARLGQVPKLLAAVRAFAALPESPALAAANKRIGNILKKADEVDAHVNPALLKENAEQALYEVMQRLLPESEALTTFLFDRLAGSLREQGFSAQEVDAVLALHPARLGQVPKLLAAVRAFAALPESPALAAANKRIGNILKKADEVDAHVNPALLKENAEQALYEVMQRLLPESESLFKAGDYTGSLQTLAALRSPVDAFFDDVMVNAEEMDVRLNRQGLLKCLHEAMNRVADLSRLAS
jgi:glycyl-tRNA synthetase beta subunit